MSDRLKRLLAPRSVAVIGGGSWCENVVTQCRKLGFAGPVRPVHPTRKSVGGAPAVAALSDLPEPPDAAFIGVNREATIDIVAELAAMGAGGAVCFASGFAEAAAEDAGAASLQARLLEAAGTMPILGPNCYGLINLFDRAALWPDQHGAVPCRRGVAIITQSSNIAINLTMQRRGLPVGYVVTAGNQAQTGFAEIGIALIEDDRVTALGLHVEGVGDIRALEQLASRAAALGKPVVVLKVGRSAHAQDATRSHTAALAGTEAGARALFSRLGFAQVHDLATLAETLKLLHVCGPLRKASVASMSCSGGEASLVADLGEAAGIAFPALTTGQTARLRGALGPRVALANPLDYHTYVWGNEAVMSETFASMLDGPAEIGVVVADFPRTDRCDRTAWNCVIAAAASARKAAGKPLALVASLPENMPEDLAAQLAAGGIAPMCGLGETLAAIAASASLGRPADIPALLPGMPNRVKTLDEHAAKTLLAGYGLDVPAGQVVRSARDAGRVAQALGGRVALKLLGFAHKSEAGAVSVGLVGADEAERAAKAMGSGPFLVEEMVEGGVAELLVGVVRDAAHGMVLTLGAGGILTELLADTVSLLLPSTDAEIRAALDKLRLAKLLSGYRGQEPADPDKVVDAVLRVQDFVLAHSARIDEVEINPLIATRRRAVAADALIRMEETDD